MATLSPAGLLTQLQHYAKHPPNNIDHDTAAQLRTAARKVAVNLENGVDHTSRLLGVQPVEAALVRMAVDLDVFGKLATTPMRGAALQASVGADPVLFHRILRGLLSYGALEKDDQGTLTVPARTAILADATFASAFGRSQDFLKRTYDALPPFLAETNYTQNPTDAKDTVVQRGLGFADKDLYAFLHEQPDYAAGFGTLMQTWGAGSSELERTFPVQERLVDDFSAEKGDVFLVDVGRGFGQKARALREKFPGVKGRFVSQDLALMTEHAPRMGDVEIMTHDFYTVQPIRGARTYYIRQTLHNFPDERCLACLRRQAEAMEPGYSRLLIHELIMPEEDIPNWTVVQDFNMMSLIGTLERTAVHWGALVRGAGLEVVEIFEPADGISESVIECVLAK